jgi:hypothetical protein
MTKTGIVRQDHGTPCTEEKNRKYKKWIKIVQRRESTEFIKYMSDLNRDAEELVENRT